MNLAGDGEATALGHVFPENRAADTLRAAIGASGYSEPKPEATSGWLYGRAVAIGERSPGGGQNNAQVTLEQDGAVSLQTPLFDQGAGGVTVLQQMVAERMGLPAERVRVEVQATGMFEMDSGIGGSRVTNVGGIAADGAVTEAQGELFKLAAELDNWPEEQMEVHGDLLVRTDTGESKPWKEVLARTAEPVIGRHTATGRGVDVTGFCVQVAEVAVDPETGHVKLLTLTTAHDTGRIINPLGHQGQINGGVMMGIGYGMIRGAQARQRQGHDALVRRLQDPEHHRHPQPQHRNPRARGQGRRPVQHQGHRRNAQRADCAGDRQRGRGRHRRARARPPRHRREDLRRPPRQSGAAGLGIVRISPWMWHSHPAFPLLLLLPRRRGRIEEGGQALPTMNRAPAPLGET